MDKRTSFGFTLIELLMVISIITLLSSIFFSYVGSASAKSRDSVRLSDMKQINTAATMYHEDKGDTPDSIEALVSTGYLSAVPVDPKTKQPYTSQTAFVRGKKVFTTSATYEKVYTTDSDGQEISQQVGVIVGDIDMSNICDLISQFVNLTGNTVDMNYPNCVSGISNDQIIGVTSGRRSRGLNQDEELIKTVIDSCIDEGGVWLPEEPVCLRQDNCDQYYYSPYNRYWTGSACVKANDKSLYITEDGCQSNYGYWQSDEYSSYCYVTMAYNQCQASGGSWYGIEPNSTCRFSDEVPLGIDDGNAE